MKRKNIHFHIQYIILLIIVFALPLKRNYIPPLLLLLSLNWLVEILTDTLYLFIYRIKNHKIPFIPRWKIIQENKLLLPFLLMSDCLLFMQSVYCIQKIYPLE